MTRRNQKRFSKRNQNFKENDQSLNKMLDLGKLNYFRYDAKEIFNYFKIDQKIWEPLLASIVTKASRLGIKDAKEYIMKLEEDDVLTKDIGRDLTRLLDKYKKWR
jgi:hypothetical protein